MVPSEEEAGRMAGGAGELDERVPSERELVATLAADVVAAVAPHEVPLFDATRARLEKDPALLDQASEREDMLGFGVNDVASFITPVVFGIVGSVVTFLQGAIEEKSKDQAGDIVTKYVHRLFRRFAGRGVEKSPARLTPEQLRDVRRVALQKARQFKLPPEKATLLADAVVGTLAL